MEIINLTNKEEDLIPLFNGVKDYLSNIGVDQGIVIYFIGEIYFAVRDPRFLLINDIQISDNKPDKYDNDQDELFEFYTKYNDYVIYFIENNNSLNPVFGNPLRCKDFPDSKIINTKDKEQVKEFARKIAKELLIKDILE
jgi:hypothetical protein